MPIHQIWFIMTEMPDLLRRHSRLSEKEVELHRAYSRKIIELSEGGNANINEIKSAYKELDAIQREMLDCLNKLP
jgi:hypothetical protein